jgi:hypothetical protein
MVCPVCISATLFSYSPVLMGAAGYIAAKYVHNRVPRPSRSLGNVGLYAKNYVQFNKSLETKKIEDVYKTPDGSKSH